MLFGCKMADVTLDLQHSNHKELYGQGIRAYVLQDYENAVKAFSKASELLVEHNESEIHDSLGDVYLYYGKSLLELSRRDGGPLGEGVPRNVEESEEEEGGDVEEEEPKQEEGKGEAETGEEKETSEEKKVEDEEEGTSEEKDEDGEANGEESSADAKEGEEEDLTDLQIAWEVLEVAKTIFRNRGDDGRKNLAETFIVLGEISLESGNFSAAIEDMSEGLKIQKTLFGNDSRTIAETFYKLGGAYSTNAQIDEAIECFGSSYEYLKNKIATLEKDKEHKDENAEEIEELKALIPEIEEKIADMKSLKTEIADKVTANVEEKSKEGGTSGASSSSASKKVNDISHLVKRKRKGEEPTAEENPAKKPSP